MTGLLQELSVTAMSMHKRAPCPKLDRLVCGSHPASVGGDVSPKFYNMTYLLTHEETILTL